MPALLATSRDLARKALMTSGPAPMFTQLETVKGNFSSPPSLNWSCWMPRYEAMLSLVPAGTAVGSAADEDRAGPAAVAVEHAPRPRAAAVPSRERVNIRRSRAGPRAAEWGPGMREYSVSGMRGMTFGHAEKAPVARKGKLMRRRVKKAWESG